MPPAKSTPVPSLILSPAFAMNHSTLSHRTSQHHLRLAVFGSLVLVSPLFSSNAQASDKKEDSHTEGKKEHTPWYSKKAQIPKTGNTQMSVRLASFYQYFHENYDTSAGNDRYSSIVNLLTFKSATRLKKGRNFSVTARIDTQNMWEHDVANRQGRLCGKKQGPEVSAKSLLTCDFGNDYRLERLSLEYGSRRISLTLGDFNVNLGRAMGLSIRRVSQIGVDAAIKGIKFRYKNKRVEAKVVGGFANRQNSDFATRRRQADAGYLSRFCNNTGWNKADRYGNSLWTICSDLVVGGRIDIKKLPGKTKLGIHHSSIFFGGEGVDAPQKNEEGPRGKNIYLTGMDITPGRIGGVWDTFVGGTVAIARHPNASRDLLKSYNGIAFYNSNNLALGNWNALIEAKYYNNYLIAYDANAIRQQYAELATLERFDQWLPGGASTAGGRIRLDYFIPNTGWDVYVNAMAYAFAVELLKDNPDNMFSESNGALALHGFGGFEYHKHHSPFTLNVALGYRTETKNKRNSKTGKRINKRTLPHLDVFAKIPLAHKGNFEHTLQITNNTWYETNGAAEQGNRFWRGNLVMEYTMAPIFTISAIAGYSTEHPSAPNSLVLDPSKVCTEEEAKNPGQCQPQIFPGVAARMNFLGRSYFQLYAGKRLGGLVCVNGSCRVLPNFVGVEAQMVLSF